MSDTEHVLGDLFATIESRRGASPDESWTAKLLDAGLERIGGKVREEADEVVEAAGESGDEGRKHTIHEAADVVYHLFVLMAWRGVSLTEVEAELYARFGTSGLEEKARREQATDA